MVVFFLHGPLRFCKNSFNLLPSDLVIFVIRMVEFSKKRRRIVYCIDLVLLFPS